MSKKTKIPEWTFVDEKTSEIYCARCGEREKLKLPMSIDAMLKFCEYFGEKHKHCKEQDGGKQLTTEGL